jgi:hypothetical protein
MSTFEGSEPMLGAPQSNFAFSRVAEVPVGGGL